MRTTDNLTLLTLTDLIVRRIVNNRMGVYRLMSRQENPFPQPVFLSNGKPIPGTTRVTGRRVAWRSVDVESWLGRLPQRNSKDAA